MTKSEKSIRIKQSEGIDRISSLPEPLLSRILSLLPTENAVATSLLSKRWKFLWTSITNLKFDYKARTYFPGESLAMRKMKFTQFVNRVLLLLNPPCIQNFMLWCSRCDPFHVDSWICAAVERTVQKLELGIRMDQSVELPLSHFHYKTLAVLKLDGCIHFKIAEAASIYFPNLHTIHLSRIEFTIANNCSVSFPSLKDLVLDYVRYTNVESVHSLFASCSSLENLKITISDLVNTHSLIISIPSLLSLQIHVEVFDFWQPKLHIDTPALKYLFVLDVSMSCFSSNSLSSLLKATIKTGISNLSDVDENSYRTDIFKFIGGLCNVKTLSITVERLEAFWPIPVNFVPAFRNLTLLDLTGDCCWWWSVVLNMLENMDNLERLVLTVSGDECESDPWWVEPLLVPMCLLHRVATISFVGVGCHCNEELELVRYFMKNAKVLKMLELCEILGTKAEKLKFLQKLLMSPRGSHECLIDVDVDVDYDACDCQ